MACNNCWGCRNKRTCVIIMQADEAKTSALLQAMDEFDEEFDDEANEQQALENARKRIEKRDANFQIQMKEEQ